jgi:hypothetical protein
MVRFVVIYRRIQARRYVNHGFIVSVMVVGSLSLSEKKMGHSQWGVRADHLVSKPDNHISDQIIAAAASGQAGTSLHFPIKK